MIIFNQKVEIIKAGKKNTPYSTEPVLDWNNTTIVEVPFPVSVQPSSTQLGGNSEGPSERPQLIDRFRLYTPPGTDIDLSANDRVKVGGVMTLEVVATPVRWPDPFRDGEVHHVEATLECVRG